MKVNPAQGNFESGVWQWIPDQYFLYTLGFGTLFEGVTQLFLHPRLLLWDEQLPSHKSLKMRMILSSLGCLTLTRLAGASKQPTSWIQLWV
jgi:hypothetical protein